MRDEYGRDVVAAGGGFAVGLVWGAAMGAAVALLVAPKTGRELRSQVADGVDRLKGRARRGYDVARDGYGRASEAVGETVATAGAVADALSERAADAGSRLRASSRLS